jgi:SAM-dependent methyltransferase
MANTPSQAKPPAEAAQLRQLIMGFRASQMIHVAAKLGVADHLEAGPQTADALAKAVGAAPRPLYRLLRALASLGIFVETGEGTFALTPMGRLLQSKPGSLRSSALLYGDEVFWSAYGQMRHSVETGEPAFEHAHGAPLFSYLATDRRAASLFHEAMREFSDREIAAILGAYDFSTFRHAVDIGGGHGALIAALLGANPHLRGTILDLEPAADGARRLLADADLADRAGFVVGSFFDQAPAGGDIYLLKSVLHNWSDEDAVRILRSCRRAIAPEGRLLVIERLIPAGNEPSEAKLFDVNMLVVLGSQERTEGEYSALFRAAGFELARLVPTESDMTLIEGVPAAVE